MDSAMGGLTDESMEVSDTSSGNLAGRVNGEVNGLGGDSPDAPATKVASLKAISIASDHITEVLSSDDESINSVENGVEEVPSKDSTKRSESGTKVPQSRSVLPSNKMDIDVSDSDDSVSAIECDPLLAAPENRAIGNGKSASDSKKVKLLNNTNHNKSDSKANGNDVEGSDSVKADGSEADKDSDQQDSSPDKEAETTPGKIKKSRRSMPDANVTPRRSSRNLTRAVKTYSDPDPADEVVDDDAKDDAEGGDESEIEEITMVDPLADSKPIIVKDTRKLVEIAAGARSMKGGAKKEPTLVIIDTNSILAGRGPVPMVQAHRPAPSSSAVRSGQGYTILPVSVSSQGMAYPKPRTNPYPQAYTRLTPIPIRLPVQKPAPPPPPPPPPILPTLTDDMYVVEAPSFIVPYVYEKPPLKPLKEYVEKMGVELERLIKLEEEEDKKKEEEEAKEKADASAAKESGEVKENKAEKDSAKTVNEEDDKVDADKPKADKDSKKNKEDESKDGESKMDKEKVEDGAKAKKDKDVVTDGDSDEEGATKAKDDKAKDDTAKDDSMKDDAADKAKNGTPVDKEKSEEEKLKNSYFENPLGKFFMNIGTNLVTEFVQTDLLRHQRRKRDREGQISASAQFAVNALLSNLELSKENNKPFHLPIKKCEHCSFKTESAMVMAQHLETPHMRNYVYRCNFCPLEVRNPPDILFHMEAEHNVRGRLERALAFHQCPNCPFEDNQKGKLSRHLMSCTKKFKPERNLEPPSDWEPPAKIPRVSRNRPTSMGLGTATYQAMIARQQVPGQSLLPKIMPSYTGVIPAAVAARGRGRPTGVRPELNVMTPSGQRAISQMRPGMMYRPSGSGSQAQVISSYQISGNQLFHVVGSQGQMIPLRSALAQHGTAATSTAGSAGTARPISLLANLAAQGNSFGVQGSSSKSAASRGMPSISITPLPRQAAVASPQAATTAHRQQQPGQQTSTAAAGKNYVICEICDGYIKDLEQLRNHMLWIHKVKIHPKMIHNRPPLNCQKCQCRFFTDQGLERHLLGTHGLVTSSMQEAANKGKDAGRCPACGRVYQWKLLSHVARDHGMVLKPAHLSYKCTVCTATFGMYKQFENHVYSAHSTQAKKVMDKKPSSSTQAFRPMSTEGSKSLLKPLKMNDEITIIPQPAATSRIRAGPASKTGRPSLSAPPKSKVHQCPLCPSSYDGTSGFSQYLAHFRRRHLVTFKVKTCPVDGCAKCKEKYLTEEMLEYLEERKKGVDVIELSDDEVVIAGQGRNEITITKVACSPGPRRYKHKLQQKNRNVHVIEIEDSPVKGGEEPKENGEDSLTAVKERLRRRKSLEISQVDSDFPEAGPSRKRRRHNN